MNWGAVVLGVVSVCVVVYLLVEIWRITNLNDDDQSR